MKLSVGIDIEEVRRFTRLIHQKSFLDRIYTSQELSYCRAKKNQEQHFAVRFAAKEAVWKAVNEVLPKKGPGLSHKDIGLKNNLRGKPEVILTGAFSRWSKKISVSLSHTRSTVVAVALFQH